MIDDNSDNLFRLVSKIALVHNEKFVSALKFALDRSEDKEKNIIVVNLLKKRKQVSAILMKTILQLMFFANIVDNSFEKLLVKKDLISVFRENIENGTTRELIDNTGDLIFDMLNILVGDNEEEMSSVESSDSLKFSDDEDCNQSHQMKDFCEKEEKSWNIHEEEKNSTNLEERLNVALHDIY